MGSRATGGDITVVDTFDGGGCFEPQTVMLADGGWIVVYRGDEIDGSGAGIAFQRFDAFGNPIGFETIVNDYRADAQQAPSIALLSDGGWIITYDSFDGPSSVGVLQQRYDANGNAVGAETVVNTTTSGGESGSNVVGLVDGGWIVTWSSFFQDNPSGPSVYQQRFDADGLPIGTETLVNTGINANDPFATALADGGWVVTYTGSGGDTTGINQQRYDAAGQPVGLEILVNTTTANNQYEPEVVTLADGGWIVVWTSLDDETSLYSVFVQRFDADGSRIGGETQVNAAGVAAQDNQLEPSIATLADGGWVIVWDERTSIFSSVIYQQRYNSDGEPVGGQTAVSVNPGELPTSPTVAGLSDGSWVVSYTNNNNILQRHFAPDVIGTNGADSLVGTQWDEALFGYNGDDTLGTPFVGPDVDMSGGADILVGGFGNDTYYVNSADDDVRELLGQGTDTVIASDNYSIHNLAVENLTLAGPMANVATGNHQANTLIGTNDVTTLHGNGGDDTLDGRDGNNVLNGGTGNDILIGGNDIDQFFGGLGNDTADYSASGGGISVSLALNIAQNTGGAGSDTLDDIENLIGSIFGDTLTGNDGRNIIEGGGGGDTMNGGNGIDTVSYTSALAGVSVALNLLGAQDTVSAGTDTLTGFESLTGSAFDDSLFGNAGANVLEGGSGDDLLNGRAGNDTASYENASNGVFVDLSIVGAQGTGAGSDTLVSIRFLRGSAYNDVLSGDGLSNRLDGDAGDDNLFGAGGNDRLIGGSGIDSFTGGTGADRFEFDEGDVGSAIATADVIQDFSTADNDRIDLEGIDADTTAGGDQAFTFVGSAAFTGTAGELRFTDDGFNTFIHGDTNGDGFADFLIVLTGMQVPIASDFIL